MVDSRGRGPRSRAQEAPSVLAQQSSRGTQGFISFNLLTCIEHLARARHCLKYVTENNTLKTPREGRRGRLPTAETENSHVCPSPTRSTPSGAFRTRPGRAPTTNKPLQTVGVTPKGNPAALSHLPALGTLLPLSVDGPLLDVPHKRDCRRWGRGRLSPSPASQMRPSRSLDESLSPFLC